MDVLQQLMSKESTRGVAIYNAYMTRTESEVGPYWRDKAMKWIYVLNDNLKYPPESFALTVHIFDTFLLTIKVKVNYLRCVAITAYFISIKAIEEEENIPLVFELLEASQCGCCKADVLKMEKMILLTLKWRIHIATPLTFLHQHYQLLLANIDDFKLLTEHKIPAAEKTLQECLCEWQLTQFRNSILSLAVLELTLEKVLDQATLLRMRNLRQITKVDSSELERCQHLIKTFHNFDNKVKKFQIKNLKVKSMSLPTKLETIELVKQQR